MTGTPTREALFLDRDGVVNVDYGYVHRRDQVVFVDGIFNLCAAARKHDLLVVIVTNQAGIARGLYSEDDFQSLMAWMKVEFAEAGSGFDAVYHCPHHPTSGSDPHVCLCRKPAPGLLRAAQRDWTIDLTRSILIGDKLTDIEAGRAAGVGRRVLLGSAGSQLLQPGEFALPTLRDVARFIF